MNRDEVAEVVESAVSEMAGWMRLGDWELKVKVGRCEEPRHVAECGRATPYMRAYITVDDQVIREDGQTADDIRNHVRHELIHVLLAEIDLVYEAGRATMTDAQVGQFERTWRFALERTVRRIEAAFDGLAEACKTSPSQGEAPVPVPPVAVLTPEEVAKLEDGRFYRVWQSRPGVGVSMSLLLGGIIRDILKVHPNDRFAIAHRGHTLGQVEDAFASHLKRMAVAHDQQGD